jgi:hypothetical protein
MIECNYVWEYLTLKLTDDTDLDAYGVDGWELVAVTEITGWFPTAYLKRRAACLGSVPMKP